MKPKFTPGPWQAGEIIRGPRESDPASGGRGICRLYSESRKAIKEEQLANACLIAACPEMLEALQAVVKAGMIGSEVAKAQDLARKVIAKATGGDE